MNRIRLLSEQVANQIAAGEVVERPASVVKELVENALDAGSTSILVEIQAGGRSLIRVTDDGSGMSKDDALLCLERHATSKIQKAEDLAEIQTMGFRGEAMPSIASVSRMSIITRERNSTEEVGTQVVIHGGKILEVKEASAASGTCIEVRQLFYNLPARRKFLRSEETERTHIQHYLTLAALAHPRVGFTFVQDGRVIWQLAPTRNAATGKDSLEDLHERLRAFYPADLALIPLDYNTSFETSHQTELGLERSVEPMRIWGWIGAPGVARSTREDQSLYVNRRPVENRGLNWALMEGYHTALMKGRFPVCCLFIEINPSAVDVNIHPAKREVKFHNEQAVRRAVAEAVRQALLTFHQKSGPAQERPQELGLKREVPPISAMRPNFSAPTPEPHLSRSAEIEAPSAAEQERLAFASPAEVTPIAALPPGPLRLWPQRVEPLSGTDPLPFVGSVGGLVPQPRERPHPAHAAGGVPLLQVPLRMLGVIGKLYVVLESDRGMVLIDQHAAHERILFEQMLRRMEQGGTVSQRLLLPETVEVTARDAQFVREHLEVLTRLGVGLSEFGERTFLLDAIPPFIKVRDPKQYVMGLIDALKATGQEVNSFRLGEEMVAKTVCRHAVKANDFLTMPELENLVHDLRHCSMPYTCPHGRPTIIEMNFKDLEKRFGRIQ